MLGRNEISISRGSRVAIFAGGLLLSLLWAAAQHGPWNLQLLVDLNLRCQDALISLKPLEPRDDLVLLGVDSTSLLIHEDDPEVIDDSRALSLMAGQGWPWSREVWALTIDRLLESGAKMMRTRVQISES